MATYLSRKEQKELLNLINSGKRTKKEEARFNALVEMSDLKDRTVSSFDTPAAKLGWDAFAEHNYQFPSPVPNDNAKTLAQVMSDIPEATPRGEARYAKDLATPMANSAFMGALPESTRDGREQYIADATPDPRIVVPAEVLAATRAAAGQDVDLPPQARQRRSAFVAPEVVPPVAITAPKMTPHQRNLRLLEPTAADFGDDGYV